MGGFQSAEENLLKYFGYAQFREGQAEVIRSVLEGRDAVVVMPTGSGKSLCYQLPATMSRGVTLVVSPLIALMKDQVEALAGRGLSATFVNSSLGYREVIERLRGIREGRYNLVYVAPERFRSEAFVASIEHIRVSLLAVDEAHCISHWGHDFRPDYLRLGRAAQSLGRPPILALTAAATAEVRGDIIAQLGLNDPRVVITGFDRPNLALAVVQVSSEKEKLAILKAVISRTSGSGIVYAATRKAAEQTASRLKMAGVSAEAYHGGMSEEERNQAQDRFMRGAAQTIVATNAFGMGIDKRDIRFIVHYHIPGSIEQYYQEIGRGGRDGDVARCILLFNYADTRTQQFFIEGGNPHPDFIERVYQAAASIAKQNGDLTAQAIAGRLDVKNEMSIRSALAILERQGIVERGRGTDTAALVTLAVSAEAALGAVPDPSIEATVLDDLIFGWNISEREDTELDLARVASDLSLSANHIRAALGGLSKRGLIRYKNAFRGREVRLIQQDLSELPVDRKELAMRASRSQLKLRKMIEYCYSKGCLHRFILKYFGDPRPIANCATKLSACSSCNPESIAGLSAASRKTGDSAVLTLSKPASGSQLAPLAAHGAKGAEPTAGGNRSLPASPSSRRTTQDHVPNPGGRLRAARRSPPDRNQSQPRGRRPTQREAAIAKAVLSCVARLNDRFGKGTIARVLAGASSSEISVHGLERVPAFGALRETPPGEINQFIKALRSAGCLEVNPGPYPTLRLSEFGRDVMHGRAELFLDFADSEEI